MTNLVGEETNVFLKGKPKPKDKDAWTIFVDSSAALRNMDASGLSAAVSAYSRQQRPRNTEPRYKKHQCETIDVSAGGYGVAWEKQVPEQLKTGELVAVREQLSLGWTIGVVRWVRQQSQGGAEFGIEYLASQAWPAAVRNLNFSESEHVRAIVLPELLIQGFETSRSEEHTSELQSRGHLVCRLQLEKKKKGLRYLKYEHIRDINRNIRTYDCCKFDGN